MTSDSAPRKGLCHDSVKITGLPTPVLFFASEADRAAYQRKAEDFDQSAADYKRMSARLAEAERLLGEHARDYDTRCDWCGALAQQDCADNCEALAALTFLQGESKDV